MKRGWCPGLYQPMAAADGLLVRVRPPDGQLTAEQLETLADATQRFGNGLAELTGQGRLQIRGLSDASLGGFVSAIVRAGLASPDPAIEVRRRVLLLPDADLHLAAQIERAIIAAPVVLADKLDITVGVDDETPPDIMLHDGTLWLAGATRAARVDDPVTAILQLLQGLAGARVGTVGAQHLYRIAGLTPTAAIPTRAGPVIGANGRGFGIGIPFGALQSDGLRCLSKLGQRHGGGRWRLTRSRALYLEHAHAPEDLAIEAAMAGFISHADDPRRRISACIGRPSCASASVDTRRDATALLPLLPDGKSLHLSGCSKRCGQPAKADFHLVGENGAYQKTADMAWFFAKGPQAIFNPVPRP